MMVKCIAYNEDGTICRRPATALDKKRGGMICTEHYVVTLEAGPLAALRACRAALAKHCPVGTDKEDG